MSLLAAELKATADELLTAWKAEEEAHGGGTEEAWRQRAVEQLIKWERDHLCTMRVADSYFDRLAVACRCLSLGSEQHVEGWGEPAVSGGGQVPELRRYGLQLEVVSGVLGELIDLSESLLDELCAIGTPVGRPREGTRGGGLAGQKIASARNMNDPLKDRLVNVGWSI
jgi:hypothetical protein